MSNQTGIPKKLASYDSGVYFPEAKTRDFADFWPPDAIVSQMNVTGFAGIKVQRRHVHRERDLAELLSAVRFRERNSQLLSLSDAAYEAGLQRIERDLGSPQRRKVRSDHLCLSLCAAIGGSTRNSGRE